MESSNRHVHPLEMIDNAQKGECLRMKKRFQRYCGERIMWYRLK